MAIMNGVGAKAGYNPELREFRCYRSIFIKPLRYYGYGKGLSSWELGVGSWELGVGSWELKSGA
jgi:hypothetical protein